VIIRDLLKRQQEILADLESQVAVYESSDLYTENQDLKSKLENLTAAHEALSTHTSQLKQHNAQLKAALYAQAEKERELFTSISKDRLQIYFSQSIKNESDKLTALEADIKRRTDQLLYTLRRNNIDMSHPLYNKYQSLRDETWLAVQTAQAQLAATQGPFSEADNDAYSQLKKEPITQEQVAALAKKNNVERFVGLNLISTIGIILLIIAAIFAGQFTVVRLTDAQRAIGIFIFGGAMLIAGEFFNRRKANVLSLGISAGGIAILYVALAFSYFALDILGMLAALVICIAITIVAFVLSTRYRSQLILILAFVGGHLPFFGIVIDISLIYGLMVHYLILNLLVLLVSFKMKWTVSTFVGLGFNIVAVWALLYMGVNPPVGVYVSYPILAGYIFLAFANYTAIPVIGTYVTRQRFNTADAAVMAINTLVSCFTIYIAFHLFGWGDFMGILAVAFSAVYFGLALVLHKKFENAKSIRDLALLTGMVFFVLIIPFQFDLAWLSLGWLLQGVALSVYGIIKANRRFKYTGMIIFGLCVFVFGIVDVPTYLTNFRDLQFALRYFLVTAGSLVILGAFMYKKAYFTKQHKIYKFVVLANVWVFIMYMTTHITGRLDWIYPINDRYIIWAVRAVLTWAFAYSLARVKVLFDDGILVLTCLLYALGIVGLFALNMSYDLRFMPVGISAGNPGVTVAATVVILVAGGLSVISLYDLLRHLSVKGSIGTATVPVIVSIYTLVIVTQNLLAHYDIGFNNIWLSVVYILAALTWTIIGFTRRYVLMRRLGLVLALLTVGKVFLLDLTGLSQPQRIVSFIVMGVVLMGISYVYQIFNKRLELTLEIEEQQEEQS